MSAPTVGDKITVKADAVLGTPQADATILEVTDFGYIVHIDGDPPEWFGPIDKDGNVLCY